MYVFILVINHYNYKYVYLQFQNLSVLQGELAKLENIKAENIILLLEGKILDPNECLHTLNITPKDVICTKYCSKYL